VIYFGYAYDIHNANLDGLRVLHTALALIQATFYLALIAQASKASHFALIP
jgi:hypothetical protein